MMVLVTSNWFSYLSPNYVSNKAFKSKRKGNPSSHNWSKSQNYVFILARDVPSFYTVSRNCAFGGGCAVLSPDQVVGGKTLVTQENMSTSVHHAALARLPFFLLPWASMRQGHRAVSFVSCSISHHWTTSDMLMKNPRVLCGWKGFQQSQLLSRDSACYERLLFTGSLLTPFLWAYMCLRKGN